MNFYQHLKPFSDFSQIHDSAYFSKAPSNWVIVVSDIKGSTQAVKEGKFKIVNMLGASAITIYSNEIQSSNTVSIFGGDGATMLMPQAIFKKLRPQFVGLIKLAKREFGISLRIGAVNVIDLHNEGNYIYVGKYKVSENTVLAQIMGPGCNLAEDMVKSQNPKAILLNEEEEFQMPNLDGLSCRLEKFASRNGHILSIIVKPKKDGETDWVRQILVENIKKILGGDFQSANPVSKTQLNWKTLPETLDSEMRFRSHSSFGRLKVFFQILIANFMLKFNISSAGFDPHKYKSEVPLQSDFKKFDDNLRMVIDCTDQQAKEIEDLLEAARIEKSIFYGIHRSDHAVTTCFTYKAAKGDHVHFVDGDGCGYTNASIQLKSQIKKNID
ncbi:MAG: DUF3095 family protein [Bdellovibrionales bacterium]|nr:DUF3095 family protein [Bdellovibrionales bacterium]MCB0415822.1 DUF3095 family protein [Bdellovibrionales bacterium]